MKEGIVAASDMEALTFVLRRGGEPANAAEQWHAARSQQAVQRLKELGVNLVIINLHKGAGLRAELQDIQSARRFTLMAHEQGLKVAGYVGSSMMYETFFEEQPEARDWRQVDEFGRPIYYTADQTFRYMACRNNPGYLAFLQKVLRLGVQDIGMDVMHFDQMQWWPEPRSCRCRYCTQLFREFLRERYPDAARARLRFGFTKFDEVIPPPYDLDAPPVKLAELHNPMMQEWARFRATALARRYGELDNYIHKLNPRAALIGNPTMDLARNVGYQYGVDLQQLLTHGDGVWTEEPNLPEWTADGRLVSQIRSYKAARAMGLTLFHWQNVAGYPAYQRTSGALRLAESLAYNDANLGVVAGSDAGGNDPPPVVRQYIDFFRAHLSELAHTTPVADVAVLRSFASTEFNPAQSNFSTVLFEQTLIQSRIPFGIVFDRHLQDLTRYKVLVLADQDALSDEQITAIRRFVENGGGLVATENTSLLTDWRTRRARFGLAELLGVDLPPEAAAPNKPVQRPFGKGRVVYIPRIEAATDPPPAQMTSTVPNTLWKLPKNYSDLAATVRWAAGGELSAAADAPPWVTMELAEQKISHTRLLHLVNFKLQAPVRDIAVRVRIPEGLTLREAVLETPDGMPRRVLSAVVRDGVASLRVPELKVYDLILLRLETK
ncbi:MAG TPA: hypothetical protein VEU62_11275 [Bryobacterales bacterium]|nr:hypothetical protein [Bryobacterales bacterium]